MLESIIQQSNEEESPWVPELKSMKDSLIPMLNESLGNNKADVSIIDEKLKALQSHLKNEMQAANKANAQSALARKKVASAAAAARQEILDDTMQMRQQIASDAAEARKAIIADFESVSEALQVQIDRGMLELARVSSDLYSIMQAYPTGMISMFYSSRCPAGWLHLDGSRIDAFLYPELNAMFPNGLPDFGGRIPEATSVYSPLPAMLAPEEVKHGVNAKNIYTDINKVRVTFCVLGDLQPAS